MRITGTPPGDAPRLQHAAGFHSSPDHLVGQLLPLARAALGRGEAVALALAPDTETALRDALGTADGLHPLGPPAEAGSGQTVAVARARELRELTRTAGPVSVLGEHRSDLDGPDGSFWTEFDAAVNVALAELPVRMTCFFPEMPLHLCVLDGARDNHPQLLVDGEVRPNPRHRAPRDVLAAYPVAPPVLLGVPDLTVAFQSWELQEVRRAVRDIAGAAGFTDDRVEDVVLAVNEVATNAVEHGGPHAELHVWATGGGLVCEVHDTGALADPLPGMASPHPSEPRGRGLWISRQVCDLLHVWSDDRGTHVRVRAAP
ncbi:anti-sigma factor RsbA family regulatory protein [Pseudonocardia hydrocarbonoxydans]|uniref:Anti-sigma regulatory factor n=1 Tax=Pseudonocardia hydrocarbonoxydans TaxID=76726 RepID=A0A4Y3WIR4_9PSEU|nr:anti-sigma factor RsbA family regulatory protein [Pseudonocardia hydrocarbonoxydans]GEC18141.1 anti-sigma regulatory factor [Pseudonocardia hydrocarbonoxydans]